MNQDQSPHLATTTLDELHLGGLSPEEEQQAKAHLAECPACSRRMASTTASADRYREQLNQSTMEEIRRRLEQPRASKPRRAWLWGLVALAATGAAVGAFLALRG
ncbi:zf-HC2 domain-containing protein [Archangium sp.]|uniref:zf-HC2 domain-containing protein n=1 Tax=Archangium sp. TaxID=1872627 RepID=UPI00286CF635|nr:zf-HC2 domain-containing protein [Archangium sp.]